jgi:2-oxo-3-hexenedioate decarboxylase
MAALDTAAVADEIADAYAQRRIITVPPSVRDAGFDLPAAYRVEAELAARRQSAGHATVGRKVGFANKALWRVLKIDTLVWAHMYDDTVRQLDRGVAATLPVGRMVSPKIEPEIVFKLRGAPASGDAAAALDAVEWLALGFEVIDCPYVDWKFQPADFVAAYGLHAAEIIGEPRQIRTDEIPALVEQLATFTVTLRKNDQVAAEGSGRNVLRSPARCLAELAKATGAAGDALAAGEVISTGTLTDSQPIGPDELWTVDIAGLDLPAVSVRTTS